MYERHSSLIVLLLILGASTVRADQPPTVYRVNDLPGRNIGEKIQKCIDLLPTQGGTCDAVEVANEDLTIAGLRVDDKGVKILLGAGNYQVTDSILFNNVSGPQLVGTGASRSSRYATVLTWRGTNGAPVLVLHSVSAGNFSDFMIEAMSAASAGIYADWSLGGTTSTRNSFERITLAGGGYLTNGIQLAKGTRGDANNDLFNFSQMEVGGFTNAAASIEHSQSKSHKFRAFNFNCGGVGRYGISTLNGGSFFFDQGGGGSCLVADFMLGASDDVISVTNSNFEDSASFLLTIGRIRGPWAITIANNRWSGGSLLPASGTVVKVNDAGPLRLEGNDFGNGLSKGSGRVLQFIMAPAANTQSAAVATGNVVRGSASPSFVGSWTLLGNVFYSSDTPENGTIAITNRVQ